MLHEIKLSIYYMVISKLPNSRFLNQFNSIRMWYLSKVIRIIKPHDSSKIQENVYIGDGKKISIGFHCQINENVFIQGATIGNFVMIAPNVAILSATHKTDDSSVPMIMQGATEHHFPEIGNDVWIGRNAIIMPGVKVSNGCIIGAGAIVTKDIPPYSVAAGVPARIIKKRPSPTKAIENLTCCTK